MLYQAENPHGGDRYGRAVELDFSVPWARRPPSAGRRLPPRGGWTGIRTPSAGS